MSQVQRGRHVEELDELMIAFAPAAAHQLGEAMALISGYSEVLRQELGERLDTAGESALAAVGRGTERLRIFTDELLELIDPLPSDGNRAPLELSVAVNDACTLLADDITRVGARVEVGELPAVLAEREPIARAIAHLVREMLAARGPQPPQITVRTDDAAPGRVAIILEDNGRQITPEGADAFFEPFVRPRGRGALAGAGLASVLCRRLIEAERGRISAEPGEDAGVRVRLELDAA